MRESNKSSASVYSRNIFSKVRGTDVKHSNEDDKEEYYNEYENGGGAHYEKEYDEDEDEEEEEEDDKYESEIDNHMHLRRAIEIEK